MNFSRSDVRKLRLQRSFLRTLAAALFSLFVPFSAGDLTAAETSDAGLNIDRWQVIYIAGSRVGYGRTTIREVEKNGRAVFVTSFEEHLRIKRFGQPVMITSKSRTEETLDGVIIEFSFESMNPPAQPSVSRGRVNGRTLTLESTIDGRTTTRSVPWDPEVKSPVQQEKMFRDPLLKPGDTRSFKIFMPDLSRISSVHLAADDIRKVKLHDGSERQLLKVRIAQSALPGIAMRQYLDEAGNTLRTEADLLGMVTYDVPSEVALQEIAGEELDIAVNSVVTVKNPPARLNNQRNAVFRITTSGRDPAELIPASETQSVSRVAPDVIEVKVQAITPPKGIQRSRSEQLKYLGQNDYLQTRDYRVKEHAQRAVAGSLDPGTIATRMETYVYKEMKKKNFSTILGSAAEVARTMEGDCT